MTVVAVIVHKKKVDGGRKAVRRALAEAGVEDVLWYEVPKSKKAPKKVRKAMKKGAELVLAWGGDGTVQRCVDVVAGSDVRLAIIPAGTSNLLATSLGLPGDPAEATRVGLEGDRRTLDTGTLNGEHFAVVAGVGIDAVLVRDASSDLKSAIGRAAYALTGVRNADFPAFEVDVMVDDQRVFRGQSTSVLIGNVPGGVGGLEVFERSDPTDGELEVGILTAEGPWQMVRAVTRTLVGHAEDSPFVRTAAGRSVVLQLDRPVPYELDGGERDPVRTLEVDVHPLSLTVCVPRGSS